MESNFSNRVKEVISLSREEAVRLGHDYIGPEHLLLGLIQEGEGQAIKILIKLGVDLSQLKRSIEDKVKGTVTRISLTNLPLTRQAEMVLKISRLEAKLLRSTVIGTEYLLMSILREEKNVAAHILSRFGITYDMVRAELEQNEDPVSTRMSVSSEDVTRPRERAKSKTPILYQFGHDLTKAAEENNLGPSVGRENEINRVAQILNHRKKNNLVLIGEPGVGKTAIVEGLALRIVQRKVGQVLYNKRIVTLDIASLVARTKYRGQFETRLRAVLIELAKLPDVILFIDDFQPIFGTSGVSGSITASNIFKLALTLGEIQCIGATTIEEYQKYNEKDGALDRHFQKIMVPPSSVDETIEILNNIKHRFEDNHNVRFKEESIRLIVELSDCYILDKALPVKAIDVLDEAGARIRLKNIKTPQSILDLQEKIEELNELKIKVVESQDYEEAARLRDREKRLLEELKLAKIKWDEETKNDVFEVDDEDIYEILSDTTGVEIEKLKNREDLP